MVPTKGRVVLDGSYKREVVLDGSYKRAGSARWFLQNIFTDNKQIDVK